MIHHITRRYGLLIVITVFAVFAFFIFSAQVKTDQSISEYKNSLETLKKNPLISMRENFVEQSYFVTNDVQKNCPYRKPNSLTYRRCLIFLINDRDEEAERYSRALVKDVAVSVASDIQKNKSATGSAKEDFINELFIMEDAWDPYREAYCVPQSNYISLESEQTEVINECKLYETYKYMMQLKDFRRDLHL